MEFEPISSSITIESVGVFTVSAYMDISFEGEDSYWETHVSSLNVAKYPMLWKEFVLRTKIEIGYNNFAILMEKLFKLYEVVR